MSQVLTEDDPHEMVKEGLAIGRTVKEGIDRLDLRLADKSVILPAGDPVAEKVARILKREGVPISTAVAAEDLGMGTRAAKCMTTITQKKRVNQTRKRANRGGDLTKSDHRAKFLAITGVAPKQMYGHQAQGASPGIVKAMRANMKCSVRTGGPQACTTTTLAWAGGSRC